MRVCFLKSIIKNILKKMLLVNIVKNIQRISLHDF